MKTLRGLLTGLTITIVGNLFGQDALKKTTIKTTAFTSQFLLSTDLKAVYLNFVGGSIKYTSGESSIGLTVFPSLRFGNAVNEESASDPKVVPGLAVGPMLTHRKLMFAAPVFYHGKWLVTVGVGIKIGK
jgi:hypothetical protein